MNRETLYVISYNDDHLIVPQKTNTVEFPYIYIYTNITCHNIHLIIYENKLYEGYKHQ